MRVLVSDLLTPASVIDQVIQPPTCSFFHLLFADIDAFLLVNLQTKGYDTQIGQILNRFSCSCCSENSQAFSMKFASKSVANASRTTPVASISRKIVDGGRERLPSYEYTFARVCHCSQLLV